MADKFARPTTSLLYRVPDLARALNCTEHAVRRMIERQVIPSHRLGRRVIVLHEELVAYLNALPQPGRDLGDVVEDRTDEV